MMEHTLRLGLLLIVPLAMPVQSPACDNGRATVSRA